MSGQQRWGRWGLTLLWLLALTVPALAATISGDIYYGGTKSGRLFVNVRAEYDDIGQHGVSVPLSMAPGLTHYQVNGVPDGNYVVSAVLDTLNNQTLRASDPQGSSAPVAVSGSDAVVNFEIADPVLPAPGSFAPPQLEVVPGNGALLLNWEAERDQNGLLLADDVDIFWSTDPDVMGTWTTSGGTYHVPVSAQGNVAFINNLTNGVAYHFVIYSHRGGVLSQSYNTVGIPRAPTGFETYTVNVSLGGPQPVGSRVYAILINELSGISFTSTDQIDSYGNATVTLNNVSPAEYRILAACDRDNNGVIDYFDCNNFNGGTQHPIIGFSGFVDLSQPSYSQLSTLHTRDASGNHSYALTFKVQGGGGSRPVNVKLLGGPQVAGPIDLALDEDGEFEISNLQLATRPMVNEAYSLEVELAMEGKIPLILYVSRVVDDFPMPIAPLGPQPYDNGQPIFTWAAPPSVAFSPYGYQLDLYGNNGWWDAEWIQTTSVPYNFNGWANQPNLNNDSCYRWRVALCDELGNCASAPQQEFIYGTGVCDQPGGGTPSTIGFESGMMEPGWNTYGSNSWFIAPEPHTGMYAMRSGWVSEGNTSILETTKTTAAGQLSFWYRVSSEAGSDYLRFYIDNILQGQWSGEGPWTLASYPVAAGIHTFRWEYSKDWSNSSAGIDAAWIDDLSFPTTGGGGEGTPQLVTEADSNASINDLGEMVWSKYDPMSGYSQIYSSVRGQLTGDAIYHFNPAVNNLGEVVWEQNGSIYGLFLGQTGPVQVATSGTWPDINDQGEVIWSQYTNGNSQIFSSQRGQLTFDPNYHDMPSVSNDGTVVWMANGSIYRLAPGAPSAEMVSAANGGMFPSISNSGEIVYASMVNGFNKVFSSWRGQLTYDLPAGMHDMPDVNACGDVIFFTYDVTGKIYRLGNNAPCLDAEPNNDIYSATPVGPGQTTVGKVNAATDMDDWYQYNLQAGQSIVVTVNWNNTPPNMLGVELYGEYYDLMSPNYSSPTMNLIQLTLPSAPYSGNYRVRVFAMNGNDIAYSIKIGQSAGNCGSTDCPTMVADMVTSSGKFNDLGEMVWAVNDPASGYSQIYSSVRGQLTWDTVDHYSPSVNNLGEVVWEQSGSIYGLLLGQPGPVQIASGSMNGMPDINDQGEVVWAQNQYDGFSSYQQIFSSQRGQLTVDPNWHGMPSISNDGTVVWSGNGGIYRLAPGASAAEFVMGTEGGNFPSISNSSEIVYSKMTDGYPKIFSTQRGQLTFALPAGMHDAPDVNACGDVLYINLDGMSARLYRLGTNAPCLDAEPNNDSFSATSVGSGQTTVGKVDMATDMDDWYQFNTPAGQPLYVTVNWNNIPPNMLGVELYDEYNMLLSPMFTAPSVNVIQLSLPSAPYSGTYRVRVFAISGSKLAYSIKIGQSAVNCGGTDCPTVAAENTDWNGSINDLGEVVWTQYDPTSGNNQIYSSLRGQLTWDGNYHNSASVNNLGELVWEQNGGIFGQLLGQPAPVQIAMSGNMPDLNDNGEVVWSQYDSLSGYGQIYSNRRGQLTFDANWHDMPSIANDGTVVWSSNGSVYRLMPGAPGAEIVSDNAWGGSISNSGEIVYQQIINGYFKVFSNQRGQLTFALPAGSHDAPEVNACGDVIFTNYNNGSKLYRLGNNAPCSVDSEPNDSAATATSIAFGQAAIGRVDAATDIEDWYQFDAHAGDSLYVAVTYKATNYGAQVYLFDQNGNSLPVNYGPGEPNRVVLSLASAPYTGTYRVLIHAWDGSNIPYALGVKRMQNAVIHVTAVGNGSISPFGDITVPVGSPELPFFFYPETGFHVEAVSLNGVVVAGNVPMYAVPTVAGMQNLEVTFAHDAVNFDVFVTGNGTVTSDRLHPGINCGVDCNQQYPYEESVTLTATPAAGYYFAGWSGECVGTEPTCTVSMIGYNRTVSANFISKVPVAVLTPNGGDILPEQTATTIAWSPATLASIYYVRYSLDGGTSWVFLKKVVNQTFIDWTTPAVAADMTNCLIKVTAHDAADQYLNQDISNAPFTIANSNYPVSVLSPNGGETYSEQSTITIGWSPASEGVYYYVRYSLDGGVTWVFLKKVASATTVDWILPTVSADLTNCLIKVTAHDVSDRYLSEDLSNAAFTIINSIRPVDLLVPNGGENLTSGATVSLQWSVAATNATYEIFYSLNGGSTWQFINQTAATSWNWKIPFVASDEADCLVKVKAFDVTGKFINEDVSNSFFTIRTSGIPVTVLSPNGGEVLTSGSNVTVQWNALAQAQIFHVRYSKDNGATWTYLKKVVGANSFNWTVPAVSGTVSTCLLKVTAHDANDKFIAQDLSDGTFTINQF